MRETVLAAEETIRSVAHSITRRVRNRRLLDIHAQAKHGSIVWIDKMVSELRAFSQGGGEVLFGTDIGYTDHYDTALEFTLMSRAGMTLDQILASLTTNPARRFGFSGKCGRVEKGTDADLVVVDDDPAKDVTALSKVRFTIRQGTIVYSSP